MSLSGKYAWIIVNSSSSVIDAVIRIKCKSPWSIDTGVTDKIFFSAINFMEQ